MYKDFPAEIKDPVEYFAFMHRMDNTEGVGSDELSRVACTELQFMADGVDPDLIKNASTQGLLRAIDHIRILETAGNN
ncbi:MAG: hypothetical protein M3Q36_00555 [bacterium]|nr:hypothetical protein [bacterium]